MAKRVLVLQHHDAEGPGRLARGLIAAGVRLEVLRADRGLPALDPLRAIDGVLAMGGPQGVVEASTTPWLAWERDLLRRAVDADVAVLGVCLGAQLLASALGARVAAGPRKELGFLPVELTAAATTDPLFAVLPARFVPLHWHGDVFELPAGAASLASSAATQHQAFRFRSACGMLFHLEVEPAALSAMCAAFPGELAVAGVDGVALQREAASHDRTLAGLTDRVARAFAASL